MKIILPIHYEITYKKKNPKKILVWLNWYRNAHYHINDKVKKHYHDLIKLQLDDIKLDTITPEYKVYVWNKLTDWPNVRAVIEKYFLDALVENWVIKNDTCDYVIWDSSYYYIDKGYPRIEITI